MSALGPHHTGALLDALADLHAVQAEEKLYPFVLNRASDVLKAQGGTYFSLNEAKGELIPEAAKGVALTLLREVPFKLKLGIAGWCATNRQAVRADSVQADERFNRAVDVITGIRTRSILCVPVARKDVVYGVVELVNRVDGIFHDSDEEFLQVFARHVAVAIENCRTRKTVAERLAYDSALVSSAASGIIATDLQGRVTLCNATAVRILGLSPADSTGQPLARTLAAYPSFVSALESTQKRQTPGLRLQLKLQKPGGEPFVVGCSTFVIRDESQNLGVAVVFQDITSFVQPS